MERSQISSFGANVKASPLPTAALDLRVETAVSLPLSLSPRDHMTTRQPSRRLTVVTGTMKLSLGALNEAAARAERRQHACVPFMYSPDTDVHHDTVDVFNLGNQNHRMFGKTRY